MSPKPEIKKVRAGQLIEEYEVEPCTKSCETVGGDEDCTCTGPITNPPDDEIPY